MYKYQKNNKIKIRSKIFKYLNITPYGYFETLINKAVFKENYLK